MNNNSLAMKNFGKDNYRPVHGSNDSPWDRRWTKSLS